LATNLYEVIWLHKYFEVFFFVIDCFLEEKPLFLMTGKENWKDIVIENFEKLDRFLMIICTWK